MADFIEAARLDELPPGTGTCVTVAGKDVALFKVDGTVYAMDDTCMHMGNSLAYSRLEGKIVTCSGHGMKYDVTTGKTVSNPNFGLSSYPVKVEDGKIMVAVDQAESS